MPTERLSPSYRVLAMILVGGGLLVIGITALLLLPKPALPTAEAEISSPAPAQVDFTAPDLQLHDLNGFPVSLADYHGQVVLVNNWATWCPPCRQEMPILEAYYRDHQHENFTIIAIDAGDPVDNLERSVDPQELLNSFRNNYLPSSYLIDRQGQVIMAWSGAVSRASLEDNITPLLRD